MCFMYEYICECTLKNRILIFAPGEQSNGVKQGKVRKGYNSMCAFTLYAYVSINISKEKINVRMGK